MPEEDRSRRNGDPLPQAGPILSIDWGTKRIGIALSDPNQTLAHPLAVLTRREGQRFPLKQLRPLIEEHQPVGILVGLPLESDGWEGDSAAAARNDADVVRHKTGLPVRMFDERMTTARVLNAMRDRDKQQNQRTMDELAATVLLQNFLDSNRS